MMREFFKNVWQKIKILSVPNLVFLIVILVFIIIPNTKFNKNDHDVVEKRPLAKMPYLIKDGRINKKFGSEFESFYNDRFRKREICIDCQISIKCFINGRHENQQAMEGKNGFYFYKGDRSVENYQKKLKFTDEELVKIKNNLDRLNDWCTKNNMKLIVIIPPDKSRIYGENYPDYYKIVGKKRRIEVLRDYLSKNSQVKFMYPVEQMFAYKETTQEPLYYYTDTHWTQFGSYVGYRALIDAIEEIYPQYVKSVGIDDFEFSKKLTFKEKMGKEGDLCINLKVKKGCKDHSYSFMVGPKKGSSIEKSPLTIALLGDSFSGNLFHWLCPSYEVKYFWYNEKPELTDNFSMKLWQDKILAAKPDIFIVEFAERFSHKLLDLYKD